MVRRGKSQWNIVQCFFASSIEQIKSNRRRKKMERIYKTACPAVLAVTLLVFGAWISNPLEVAAADANEAVAVDRKSVV